MSITVIAYEDSDDATCIDQDQVMLVSSFFLKELSDDAKECGGGETNTVLVNCWNDMRLLEGDT